MDESSCSLSSRLSLMSSSTRSLAFMDRRRSSTMSEQEVIGELNLLDRLGGMVALNSIVLDFLNRVGQDHELMVFFEGVDFRVLSAHQKRFFAMAFTITEANPSLYDLIKRRHKHLFERGLNETHFDLVAHHMTSALKARGFNRSIIEEAVGSISCLRDVFEDGAAEAEAAGIVERRRSIGALSPQ